MTQHTAPWNLVLETMQMQHLDEVLAIERSLLAPWTREMFLQEIQQQWELSESTVALLDSHVVAYVLSWFVADEVHVVNLAVHSKHRRCGIARLLLNDIFERGLRRGMVIATLEVRFHNSAAICLYERLGFKQIAIRKSYYADNGEDAIVMIKQLAPASAAATRQVDVSG